MSDFTSFRTFNSPGGPVTNGVAYALDQASGVFRPLYTSDFAGGGGGGNVTVVNTAPIAVSGVVLTVVTGAVSASFDPTAIVNAQATGNNYLASISGAMTANLTGPAWVTGDVYAHITGFSTGVVVTVADRSSASVTASAPSGAMPFTSATTFFGQALAANPARNEMFLQNTHTGIPLLVNLGSVAAGTGAGGAEHL